MFLLKKLIFAPIFLIVFGWLIYQLVPLLSSYDFIFSLSIATLVSLIVVSGLILISSFLFVLFAALSSDWKIVLPVALTSSVVPLIFFPPALAIVFAVAIFVSFCLTYVSLDNTLKSYLNFQPSSLLGPAIRHLSGLLVLSFCVVYFLSSSKLIAQNGFQIPDSLIDTALKMSPVNMPAEQNSASTQLPAISQEQLELLKQNPDLLKQYGLDPKILDTLDQKNLQKAPQDLTANLIKQTVKDQAQGFIKPYINFIPAVLALLLFITFQSLISLLNLFIYPMLWVIFFILEKTGFIKFVVEQRPVRKMVV